MSEKPIETGQELWYVPGQDRYAKPAFVTVRKVGRRWADIGQGRRIDRITLAVDGGGFMPPGTCYRSKEAYEASVALHKAWTDLHRDLQHMWSPPRGMTMEKIATIRAALSDDTSNG